LNKTYTKFKRKNMALVICPECKNAISDKASSCPKCGAPVDLQKIKENKSKTNKGCLYAIGIIFAIWIIVSISTSTDQSNNTTDTTVNSSENEVQDHTIEAFVYAQEQIEKQIKSPSSAEWPTASESLLHQKGNIYTFKSYFDSQNSYGAMIRTNYICVVEENNNLYKIKELQLFN
jgi:hypothetical protein